MISKLFLSAKYIFLRKKLLVPISIVIAVMAGSEISLVMFKQRHRLSPSLLAHN